MRLPYAKIALWSAGLAVLLVLPQVSGLSLVSLYNQIGIAIIFALAYNLLLGYSGLLSFGHAVYFGVGAFWTIQAMAWVADGVLWCPTPLLPLFGALGGLVFGFVLGIFCTRRHGTIFALITLAVGELMTALTLMLDGLSGGEEGISAWRQPWMGIMFGSAGEVYYLILAWTLLCAALMYGLTRTPFGRLMMATRDNGERAQFIGFNTYLVRLVAFALSGMFSGVAGGLLALNTELINYEVMGLQESANVLFNTYIGGMGYFSGPVIGAVLLTSLQLNLSNYTEAWLVYQGVLFILVVMFAHEGFAGLLYRHVPVIRARLMGRLLPAYGQAAPPVLLLAAALIFTVEFIYHWKTQLYSADPVGLFGVEWAPDSPWPWLTMAAAFGTALPWLRRTARMVRGRWDEIATALDEEAQP